MRKIARDILCDAFASLLSSFAAEAGTALARKLFTKDEEQPTKDDDDAKQTR